MSKKPDPEKPKKEDETKEVRQDLLKALYGSHISQAGTKKDHAFWSTQPVPQSDVSEQDGQGPIEIKTIDQVQKEPLTLPANFRWVDCNIDDEKELDEIYHLLGENYVEDDDNMFRFDYSREFLKWALKPPGFSRSLHVGVRVAGNNKLVGFITGVPVIMRVYKKHAPMVEINFLCVHKKLRSKRLAPVLIKEITRRVNCTNVWQAVYTAGVVLPKPVAKNRYWHRSLNPAKLIDIGFSRLPKRMTRAMLLKLMKVPEEPLIPGLRPLSEQTLESAHKLVTTFLEKFQLVPEYSLEDFRHWFFPRDEVVYSFVVEKAGVVTDFISFYTLPSHIIGNPKHSTLKAAYSYYNVATTVAWKDLIFDALICAKKLNFDVYNALDVMENSQFLEELKFGIGDGNLQYYLFNWKCPEMQAKDVGLVLL